MSAPTFRCEDCTYTFTAAPSPTDRVPFQVGDEPALYLGDLQGHAEDGVFVPDAAMCPRCRRLAPLAKQMAFDVETLTRLDLKPNEILAVTVAWSNPTPAQLEQFGEFVTGWLAAHGMPVAGVLVLPPGSQVQATAPASTA